MIGFLHQSPSFKRNSMREYKFRGYSKEEGKWFYGNLLYNHKKDTYSIVDYDTGFNGYVEAESVGMKTCITNSKGEDLNWWEGDLLSYVHKMESDSIKIIVFHQGKFVLKGFTKGKVNVDDEGDVWYSPIDHFYKENTIVVGNYYFDKHKLGLCDMIL